MTFDYRTARESIFGSCLPGPLRLVALVLVEYMPNCQPSVTTIAKQSGVERKTAIRAIARLERLGVISVDRRNGSRSSYSLQPVPLWRTGTRNVPVPERHGTGTNDGMGPVPNEDGTGTNEVPKAVLSRSESGSEAAERARPTGTKKPPVPRVGKVFTIPSEDPPEDYLQQSDCEFTPRDRATATWKHYWRAGLPEFGVEKLYPWLLEQARQYGARHLKAAAERHPQRRHGSAQQDHGINPFDRFEEAANAHDR